MARVLLIEPDRPLRTFIAGILADFGHDVAQARHIGECREWLERAVFDVTALAFPKSSYGHWMVACFSAAPSGRE